LASKVDSVDVFLKFLQAGVVGVCSLKKRSTELSARLSPWQDAGMWLGSQRGRWATRMNQKTRLFLCFC